MNYSIYKTLIEKVTFIGNILYYDIGNRKISTNEYFNYFLYIKSASRFTQYNISFKLEESSDIFEGRNNNLFKGKNVINLNFQKKNC